MRIGYARVSTEDQNLDLQIDALNKYECDKIFSDKISGVKSIRPELEKALDQLRPGDEFIVWKLDRLGRSLSDLIEKVKDLDQKGVVFKSLNDSIDTATASGRFIFHLFGALSEFERSLISERTKAGLAAARLRGVVGGRKPKLNDKEVKRLKELYKNKSMTVSELCKQFEISKPTLYSYIGITVK